VVSYAAVLDGHTLNLCVLLPAETPGDAAEVTFRQGRRRLHAPARIRRTADGRLQAEAAVLLGAGLGGLPVDAGRWKAGLLLGGSRRLPLVLPEPTGPQHGLTRQQAGSVMTGLRHRIGRTTFGTLRLHVSPLRPSAEVVQVHLDLSGVQVDFRVVGDTAAEGEVEFVARGRTLRIRPQRLGDRLLRVAAPLTAMTPARRRPEHWDVVFCAADGRRLRLGHRLHDLHDPARVRTQARTAVAAPGAAPLVVEPRYTPAANFRITCSRMTETP
jgi:hypothetical protein